MIFNATVGAETYSISPTTESLFFDDVCADGLTGSGFTIYVFTGLCLQDTYVHNTINDSFARAVRK